MSSRGPGQVTETIPMGVCSTTTRIVRPLEETMCRAVVCRTCGKPTWAGCGQHVEMVLQGVPKSKRCQGHADEPKTGLFARIFGR